MKRSVLPTMKRKLDEHDQPIADVASSAPPATPIAEDSFADLGLDPRLLQALVRQHYRKPTPVQLKAVPLILDRACDVLARAKTGSGKTAAYCLPILEAILRRKKSPQPSSSNSLTSALILVPTRELADQVSKNIEAFSSFSTKEIQAVKLSDKLPEAVQRSLLAGSPDIVIATPSKALNAIKSSALSLDSLSHLVLDEADIILSYGYEEDLRSIATSLPKGLRTTLVTATLSPEVDTLKELFCRNPTILDLDEPESEDGLDQYVVTCGENEKFLLIYVLVKCKLVRGKLLIFVADTDRCYRLKIYLEQFGIRACVLNSELPVNSRLHIVESYNRNLYDIIICADENEALGSEEKHTPAENSIEDPEDNDAEDENQRSKETDKDISKKTRSSKRDKEFGVSRGIDFAHVAMVINFDLPTSARSYTHRIGRTARAGQTGMALSFVVPKSQFRKHMPTSIDSAEHDEKVLAKIIKQQAKKRKEIKPYIFDMKQLEAFRYRMNDALRAVTRVAVREARTRELRQELLKSEKLSRHFAENPEELHHLRHDGELRAARTQAHLRNVPDYLLPKEGKKALTSNEVGFVPFKKIQDGKGRRGKVFKHKGKRTGGRKSDPLKSFKARSKKK